MFDVLHLRARCWNSQQARWRGRGRWGRRREGKKINFTFFNQKMSLKIMLYGESKSSEFSLHSVYLPVRSQLMFCMEVVLLYERWGQLTLTKQGLFYGWKEILNAATTKLKVQGKRAHEAFINASQTYVQFIKLLAWRILWICVSS